ncbi:MAG: restriction endonuclease subunit S [Pyrinomonadaceae bacterium]
MSNHKYSGWISTTLGEICNPTNGLQTGPFGSQLHAEDYTSDGVPVIMPKDITRGRISEVTIARIPEATAESLKKHRCSSGDIVFGRRGDIGRCGLITNKEEGWLCGTGCLRARLNGKVSSDYLIHALNLPQVTAWLVSNAVGQTMLNLNTSILSELPLELPPLGEQTKIAEVLTNWDASIEQAEKLITAKALRKRGLMQQLLTGKNRFPEFQGQEWVKVSAGDLFKNVSVKGNKNEELLSATQDRGMIPRSMLEARVTMPTGDTHSFKLVEVGDFVISLRSFQGGLEYSYYRGIVSPAYTVLKQRKTTNAEFYKQYFKSYEFIGRLATAVIGIRDGKQVSYEDFCLVNIPFPSIKEQARIAEVLNTCDREIDLLKQQLVALKRQKLGLMQKLLTGQIRVKVDDVEAATVEAS